MAATMARQGGRVQLEQSDMRVVLNLTKMANGRLSRTAKQEMQYLIKKPRAELSEEKKQDVELAGQKMVKAAMERHPAMICHNHMDGCLPCQNGTATNLQTR